MLWGVMKKNTSRISLYVSLMKPRILTSVVITTTVGYLLGAQDERISFVSLLLCLVATILVGGGSSALNNYIERFSDSLMPRTASRPLPRGDIASEHALSFGVILVLAGLALFVLGTNLLSAFIALLASFLYVVVYTPMKRRSVWNTFVGAIPGALPPLWGWTASNGSVGSGGIALFLILFVWQHPHFFAIAWMYRDQYRRAGFKMLPAMQGKTAQTKFNIALFSILLFPVSLLPTWFGAAGLLYSVGIIAVSVYFGYCALKLIQQQSDTAARGLLRASVIYLPVMLGLISAELVFASLAG